MINWTIHKMGLYTCLALVMAIAVDLSISNPILNTILAANLILIIGVGCVDVATIKEGEPDD